MRTMVGTLRILFVISLIWGCSKPNPEISAMKANLLQMSSISPSPFDQSPSPKTSGYAIFQGRCISIIQSFQININDSGWRNIPSTPEAAQTGETTPGYTYDLDCSDGNYTFWIYLHQLTAWGFDVNGNGTISSIAIRGIAGSFATEPTVYLNNNTGNVPTNIVITKGSGPNGTLANACLALEVSLINSSGNYSSSNAKVNFVAQVSTTTAGASTSFASFPTYQNYNDCSISTATTIDSAQLSIPASQNYLIFYYKVPASLTAGDILKFNLASSSPSLTLGTTFYPNPLQITIKGLSDRYVVVDLSYAVVDNVCYPGQVIRYKYDDIQDSSINSAQATFNLPPELSVYSDATCVTRISSTTIASYQASSQVYFKVASGGGGHTNGTISATVTGFDSVSTTVSYDTSGYRTADHISLYINPIKIKVGQFTQASVAYVTYYGTPIPASSAFDIDFTSSSGASVNFCDNNASCSVPVTGVNIPSGGLWGNIYVKGVSSGATDTVTPIKATLRTDTSKTATVQIYVSP